MTTVDGKPGILGRYHCLNPNASAAYIEIFDTTGAVTLGSTLPALSLGRPGFDGSNLEWTIGTHFADGI